MNSYTTSHRTTDGTSATSLWLLRNPIDYIAEDHLRLRAMCAEMDRLANSETADRDTAAMLSEYLGQELPLLLADEDDDLLPCLLRRAEPEDELPKLALRLHQEHTEISKHLSVVVIGVDALRPGREVPAALATALHALANATRRHLILENAVLLPLSRARLTKDDLRHLRAAMLKRRGLDDLFAA
ncbi:MAG: hemerythrin domain-containing protein [Pseudomonadota bacterium]